MKRNKTWLGVVASVFLLSSCSGIFNFSNSNSQTYIPPSSTNGYYKADTLSANYYQYGQAQGTQFLPSLGNQKILVVPIDFSNSYKNSLPTDALDRLDKAFFGDSDDTSWQSVASFYHESSYGRLTITGEVTPWVNLSIRSNYLDSISSSRGYLDPTYYVLEEVYKSLSTSTLAEYDLDKDGYIDALWLVYAAPTYAQSTAMSDTFWAYTYWYYQSDYLTPTSGKPIPGVYAWASYHFLEDGYGTSGIDAHTFIHETGHILGLDDYYDYDGKAAPMGYIDMMDANIIDHNAFSKIALGWIEPIVVTDSSTITISPSYANQDAILINNSWNGLPFDEYILLEFYEPKGLNEKDSQAPYPDNNYQGFTIPGIRVYHVDARLVQTRYDENFDLQSFSYVDTITEGYQIGNSIFFTEIAHSNTPSRSIATDNYSFLSIVDGTTKFTRDSVADNQVLFLAGETLSLGNFNDGSKIGYSFEVLSISNDSATIKFTAQ
ncbi:MAG: hypothetical protein WCQ71_00285 [Bacilli bacterium]